MSHIDLDMSLAPGSAKVAAVTTSWDDGHRLDLRLAERLSARGVRGTFYVPMSSPRGSVLSEGQIRELRQGGMEVGAHTVNHPVLTNIHLDEARYEIVESKRRLEDVLGEPVTSFCYPEGEVNSRLRALTIQAGYKLARTTIGFRSDLHFDPFRMPVSLQCLPRSRRAYLRTAAHQRNLRGVLAWCRAGGMQGDLFKLSASLIEHISRHGGILHLWGHSWEIEELGLWKLLEDLLDHLSGRPNILYLTNSELLSAIKARGTNRTPARQGNRGLNGA